MNLERVQLDQIKKQLENWKCRWNDDVDETHHHNETPQPRANWLSGCAAPFLPFFICDRELESKRVTRSFALRCMDVSASAPQVHLN